MCGMPSRDAVARKPIATPSEPTNSRRAVFAKSGATASKSVQACTRSLQPSSRSYDRPRGIAPPRSSSLKRLSPDSTAFDSVGYLTTVFIVLLGGDHLALAEAPDQGIRQHVPSTLLHRAGKDRGLLHAKCEGGLRPYQLRRHRLAHDCRRHRRRGSGLVLLKVPHRSTHRSCDRAF
jgi:hypothetical protein